ncbi:PREDICTED: uncharacterized protein LOC104750696 [Camelina sativa]|uniref:Uncharacterized protein LOC104750696 n=1 Tax=Camelina sativa TaxID=90675 RepID=A0ABM0WGN4_CAMSA|nr:PREDICTED: uncharacterized protein LOC104750696 [Camelina sativa]
MQSTEEILEINNRAENYSINHKISFDLRDFSGTLIRCELFETSAAKFYDTLKSFRGDRLVCVIRWALIEVFQGKRSISSRVCTQIKLNLQVPEVAKMMES